MTEHGATRPRSVRALSELARSGYNLMLQPSTELEFEVHHVGDRPGRLLELLRSEEEPSRFLETMSSGANGVGVVVGTRLRDAPGTHRFRDQGSGSDPRIQFTPSRTGYRFQGVARPNLTFLYEAASRLEGIIAVEDEPKTATHSDTLLIKDLIREITFVASQHALAPLLSIQCPAQRPVESNVEFGHRKLPPSSSLSIRFTIALDEPSVSARMRIAAHLTDYCEKHGYRMWLSDTRPGHRSGNWFCIRSRAQDDERRRETWSNNLGDRVNHVLPVTFVGPARVGSSHAIVSFLRQFDEVGILGCSSTALDDLAFVHLQLALSDRASLVTGARFPAVLAKSNGENPLEHLGMLLAHFYGGTLGMAPSSDSNERVGDYQTLAGPLLRYTPARRERKMALWVSWQMTRRVRGLVTPIDALMRAWQRLCKENPASENRPLVEPSIEYMICRDIGNSVLHGKGKLSVPYKLVREMFPEPSTESPAARLCVGLEDAWKCELDSSTDGMNVLGVTVAWREYWLGHWSSTA
jgi:hypothetical protein